MSPRQRPDPHARLAEIDPTSAARLHPNDRVRVIRALEVYEVLGKPLSEAASRVDSAFDALYLVLGVDRSELHERINHRTHAMIAAGLIQEVQGLVARYGLELPLLQTLGYAEILAHLQGTITLDEAISSIQLHTRQYAKRQITWFKGESEAIWVKGEREALELIQERFGAKVRP